MVFRHPSVALNGTQQTTKAILDVRTVTMPASYATDGHPIDLSATYSTVHAIQVLRAFTTSGSDKTPDGRLYAAQEKGTDLYSSGKFRMRAMLPTAGHTPAGTNSTPTFTGDALGAHTHTYDKADTPVSTPTELPATGVTVSTVDTVAAATVGGPDGTVDAGSGLATADPASGSHAHAVTVDRNWLLDHKHTLTHSSVASGGTSGGTPTGTVTAPTFTGTPVPAAPAVEVAAATDLSGVTVQYLVIGVPV